jgi:O-antigen/teichoic acid export membrane protein
MNFGARAKSELSGASVQFAVSVALAFAGSGVWSLVLGSLAGALASTSAYWLLVPWRPRPSEASWKVLRELMIYGRPVLGARIFSLASGALDKVLLGRLTDTGTVGFYSVTFRLATLPESIIGYVVGRPMFAAYSSLQHDVDAVRRAYAQQLERTALLTLPLGVGLAIAAEPIVLVLFGEKWQEVILTLRILALYSVFWALLTPAADLWRGIGKPHLEFLFGLLRLPVLAGALLLLIPRYGLEGAALAVLVASVGTGLPSLAVTLRIIGLRLREFGRALAPAALSTATLGAFLVLVLPLSTSLSPPVALAILASVGVLAYVGAVAVFARRIVIPIWLNLRASGAQRHVVDESAPDGGQ